MCVGQIKDNSSDLVGLDGGEVHTRVPSLGVDAVICIVFAGVFWRGLRQDLVDTFSANLLRDII